MPLIASAIPSPRRLTKQKFLNLNLNAKITMKHNVLAGSICTLFMVALSANSEAQLSIKAGNVKVDASTSGSPANQSGASDSAMTDKIKLMQDNIQKATDRLKSAGKSGAEQVSELVKMSQTVQEALKEVSEGGSLHEELQKSIAATQAKAKMFHDKSTDPNLSAQMQSTYNMLEQKANTARDKLYQTSIALQNERSTLEKTLKSVNENKELVADLISLKELEAANEAIIAVIGNMKNVNQGFTELLGKIPTGMSEKTQ